jgi:hypothetical protein
MNYEDPCHDIEQNFYRQSVGNPTCNICRFISQQTVLLHSAKIQVTAFIYNVGS